MARRVARPAGRHSSTRAPVAKDANLLPVVLHRAVSALQEADGRAAGVKFNKLVMDIYWQLSKAENKRLHFGVPYRWYLYGAVVDDYVVRELVRFDHPEDEMRTNVVWVPDRPPRLARDSEGASEEIDHICAEFARKYAGPEAIAEMLRDHYTHAPEKFQKDFLEWSLSTRAILRGYESDSPDRVRALLRTLSTSYPRDLEPRLTPAFQRLALYLEPIVDERKREDFSTLRLSVDALWEFWATFGLFLSLRHNEGIPADRLAAYRKHAETELEAYKRRLSAFLEQGYLKETKGAFDLAPLGQFFAAAIRDEFNRDDVAGG